jgi:acetyltransferase
MDGRTVLVRPILPEDEAELRRAVAGADPETLRRRFLGGRPPQTDADFAHLVQVDYRSRLAVVALGPDGQGVGLARYETLPGDGEPGTAAEVAVAVDPAWRHVGLATVLLRALAEGAQRAGIRRFQAEFFADNVDISDLLAEAGVHYVREQDATGVVTVAVLLPEPGEPAG